MTKYHNHYNGMIYWVEGEIVVCAEPDDLSYYIKSSFSLEEFAHAVATDPLIQEIK